MKTLFKSLGALLFASTVGLVPAFAAEGGVGTTAYSWSGYKALDSVSYPSGVGTSNFQGKAILLVVFQYNCGGCTANAPKLGKLADSLGSGQVGIPFQAIGAEIDNGTFTQIQTSYNAKLKQNAANVKFPLVHVPFDTAIITDGTGTKWKRYNSYRDVYFVINSDGSIRARIEGDRQNPMTAVKYDSLKTQLVAAIAAVPAAIASGFSRPGAGLKVVQRGASFYFDAGAMRAPVSVKIQDLQGRMVRAFTISRAGSFVWDGKDAAGKQIPFGTYFVRASDGSLSSTQRITVLP